MSTTLQRMADWAADLGPGDLPPRVRERILLQHLGLAGAVRTAAGWQGAAALGAGGRRGEAALVTGGRAPRREAARLHATLGALLELDDRGLGGHTGVGAVPAAWACAGAHEVDRLVVATAAGGEVAGRLGAALLLSADPARGRGAVTALAAATTAGLLAGLDAPTLAHAMALALVAPRRSGWREVLGGDGTAALATGQACADGVEAAGLAAAGLRGPLDLLDRGDGLLSSLSPAPLRTAFTGLGRAWLTRSLSWSIHPVAPPLQGAVQAVEEILARHVKAAEKRLRWDQVERIEVGLGAPGFALHGRAAGVAALGALGALHRLPEAIGRLVVGAELDPRALARDAAAEDGGPMSNEVAHVARRVEVHHAWPRTRDLVDHSVDVLGPLLVGLDLPTLRRAAAAWTSAGPGATLSSPVAVSWLLRLRPDQLLERLRYQSGDLADCRLDELQERLGADVVLHTTRGGSWRERRDGAVGSPGWPWQDTVERLLRRWGAGPEDAERARALTQASGPAAAWVEALLGRD